MELVSPSNVRQTQEEYRVERQQAAVVIMGTFAACVQLQVNTAADTQMVNAVQTALPAFPVQRTTPVASLTTFLLLVFVVHQVRSA